jgi:type I restriction enzyme S subunit
MTAMNRLPNGYRQTEVGVIPVNWEVRAIGELCEYQNGTSLEHLFNHVDGLKVISIGNYSTSGGYIDNGVYINLKHRKNVEKFLLRRNDLTMSMNDKTAVGAIIGRVLLIAHDDTFVFNQRTMRLRPKLNVSPAYLHHAINADRAHSAIVGLAKPGTQIYVNTDDVIDLRLPTPPLPEQRAIATALSDVDALLAAQDKLIAKKRDIKQAVMQQLLTGKQRLPGFSGEWEVNRLGDVVEIRKGQLITEKDAIAGNVPVIAGGKKPAYYHNKPNRTGKTITVSASGASAGYVAFFDLPIFASDCSTIGEGSSYSIEFIYFQLQLKQEVIYKAQTGGAQPHIHAVDLMPLEVGNPSMAEQTAIAAILSDMDADLAALEQQRDKTRALKQGMMQELLTGRIRLV